jgi:hypothetical protein
VGLPVDWIVYPEVAVSKIASFAIDKLEGGYGRKK